MLLWDGTISRPVAQVGEYAPVNENPFGGLKVKLDPASSANNVPFHASVRLGGYWFNVWDYSSLHTLASSSHSEKYRNLSPWVGFV